MADLLGISISGLKFSQSALKTTSHNITNADTAGYIRQRALAATNPATYMGSAYVGNGVNLQAIEGIVSEFAIEQLNIDTRLFNELETFNDFVLQVDKLLSDPATGVSAALQSFYAAVQNGANDPTSVPSRQLIIAEAGNLATRFNTLYDKLDDMNRAVNAELETSVSEINALSGAIANLNGKIADALGAGQGAEPNDLLGQRYELLRQLSEYVSVNTFDQGDGQINVLIGNGQPLVVGTSVNQLRVQDGRLDAESYDIVFDTKKGSINITDQLFGGKIGGHLKFREEILAPTTNELGRLAVVLGETFNEIHAQGVDLNNLYGKNFFNDANADNAISARVKGASTNAQPDDRRMALTIADARQITASDYEMTIGANGSYTITRLTDDQVAAKGILAGAYPLTIAFDGLELEVQGGSFTQGDQFLLQPTRQAARFFGAQINRTEDIAFASPLLTDDSLANQGNGKISAGTVLSARDDNGNLRPLFANVGEFSPPLIVKFTSPTTYDILDNSDPANPVQLDPPIRNQRYVPGLINPLFSEDPGSTLVASQGRAVGLPAGSTALLQAALKPTGAVPPNFAVTDFSAPANQFTFDVVIANTLNGLNDGTFTVTINSPGIVDTATLLADINDDLAASNAVAYMDENGELAFRMRNLGYGDLTVQNYISAAPAGQSNNLLGFNVEGASFTTAGGASGVSGQGLVGNRYPAEIYRVVHTDPQTGLPVTQQITGTQNGSARFLASSLSNLDGVTARAHTVAVIENFNLSLNEPLQLSINGTDLIEYLPNPSTGVLEIAAQVPDPSLDLAGFVAYVAQRINDAGSLDAGGFYAQVMVDPATGRNSVQIVSSQGDDIDFRVTGQPGESVDVGDGRNPQVRLVANGNAVQAGVVVGGLVDVTLADGYDFDTLPAVSQIFGDSNAANFQQSQFLGIQASIDGNPQTGDSFTLDFNPDASADNRNAIKLVDLELEKTVEGNKNTFAGAYGKIVEEVGTKASASQINRDAAEKILAQSQSLRDSISGVNLEEEAASLIRYEQLYNANAQAISVARDLFDRLLSSF